MGVRRDLLLRFLLLYGMLYCSFGLSSPFLPAFLAARGVGSEWLGFLLGAGTAVRLLSAPFAGRLADVFGAFRLELALFAIAAAVASLLYLPAHYFCQGICVTDVTSLIMRLADHSFTEIDAAISHTIAIIVQLSAWHRPTFFVVAAFVRIPGMSSSGAIEQHHRRQHTKILR